MKVLYRFHWDLSRSGVISGVFIADDSFMENAYGKDVYFGEILGKHSDVHGTLDRDEIEVMSDDQVLIDKLIEVFGGTHISGYNPLEYLSEDEDE